MPKPLQSALRLTRDIELDLADQIAGGSDTAAYELIHHIQPLIGKEANAFRDFDRLDRESLMQEGWIGALHAARAFRPSHLESAVGAPAFPAYARLYVRDAMTKYAAANAYPTVVPLNAFKKKTGREADHTIAKSWNEVVSIDAPAFGSTLSDDRIGDVHGEADDDAATGYQRLDARADVTRAVRGLGDVHRRWALMTGAEMAPKDIARELGVTTARVSQIKAAALAALTTALSDYAA